MDNTKKRRCIWLTDETYGLVNAFYRLDNCSTQSIFVERAIIFYSGYISSNKTEDYMATTINASVKNALSSFENRMAKLLFKFSVEQALMMNVVAAYHEVEQAKLDRIRGKCVEEVKRTRGRFDFNDAMSWQHGDYNVPSDS